MAETIIDSSYLMIPLCRTLPSLIGYILASKKAGSPQLGGTAWYVDNTITGPPLKLTKDLITRIILITLSNSPPHYP
jgi:hypothetical protein